MAFPPLLSLKDISLTFGGTPLLEHAELSIAPGERACLVGRNGSGKSTLLRIAAGLVEPDGGVRFIQPGATIRYLSQEPDLTGFATTLEAVQAGLGPGDDPFRASYLLHELGLNGEEDPRRLSGGEARRCALAGVLAPAPDILLLDEPTNHLDVAAIEWLEGELRQGPSALVLISHDRAFLRRLSQATTWLDRGRTRRIEQGFEAFEAWRDKTFEEEERDRHKLDRKIEAENDWLRYGVTARRKRNVRRLGALHELRRERREARHATGSVTMTMSQADLSGKLVIEAERISKAFAGRPIVSDLSLRVLRGDRLGIVGANGQGKTTLLKLLTGALAPDSGSVRLGTNLEILSLDQHRESLDDRATVTETLTEGRGDMVVVGGQPRHVAAYMKDFLFSPEQARSPVGVLSGGERNRLMLARALARPSNLLVLDEPTNDLDLETLDLLQEQLAAYAGTILLVSHDRDFLDRVVSSVLVAEGGGRWVEYAGGYSDMLAQRGSDAPSRTRAAPPPTAPKAARAASAPDQARKRRLGFNEQHELKTLPARLAEIEARIVKLNAALADPDFYGREEALVKKAAVALAEAQASRDAAENRWLELEMLRETLEG